MIKQLTPFIAFLTLLAVGCADPNADEGSGDTEDPILRMIAGTSAVGRAGSWSDNCLDENCVRADSQGNYLLSAEANEVSLMTSDIPNADGSSTNLYSLYRHDDEITTALVNFNPSTHAILDIWANHRHNQTIEQCSADSACESSFRNTFTEAQQETITLQLDTLLGDAWPPGRDPFSDVYVADSSDALDVMHDYIQFVVTTTDLMVQDNNGVLLTQVSLGQLVTEAPLDGLELTGAQYTEARSHSPPNYTPNNIILSTTFSPSQPNPAPVDLTADSSRSESPNGELTFLHELTVPSGIKTTFEGAVITTALLEGGSNIWVVTATDPTGQTRTQGQVLQVLIGDETQPAFGGDGSCITPSEALNANRQNLCQETQNGGELGSCDEVSSPSIVLTQSPAPCAHQSQNEGLLFGVCTVLVNEVRTFHYENPHRPNFVETFEEKQERLRQQCVQSVEGEWSNTP